MEPAVTDKSAIEQNGMFQQRARNLNSALAGTHQVKPVPTRAKKVLQARPVQRGKPAGNVTKRCDKLIGPNEPSAAPAETGSSPTASEQSPRQNSAGQGSQDSSAPSSPNNFKSKAKVQGNPHVVDETSGRPNTNNQRMKILAQKLLNQKQQICDLEEILRVKSEQLDSFENLKQQLLSLIRQLPLAHVAPASQPSMQLGKALPSLPDFLPGSEPTAAEKVVQQLAQILTFGAVALNDSCSPSATDSSSLSGSEACDILKRGADSEAQKLHTQVQQLQQQLQRQVEVVQQQQHEIDRKEVVIQSKRAGRWQELINGLEATAHRQHQEILMLSQQMADSSPGVANPATSIGTDPPHFSQLSMTAKLEKQLEARVEEVKDLQQQMQSQTKKLAAKEAALALKDQHILDLKKRLRDCEAERQHMASVADDKSRQVRQQADVLVTKQAIISQDLKIIPKLRADIDALQQELRQEKLSSTELQGKLALSEEKLRLKSLEAERLAQYVVIAGNKQQDRANLYLQQVKEEAALVNRATDQLLLDYNSNNERFQDALLNIHASPWMPSRTQEAPIGQLTQQDMLFHVDNRRTTPGALSHPLLWRHLDVNYVPGM